MTPNQKASKFEAELTEIANIAKRIGQILELKADAQQACFATILISADRNGLLFSLSNSELPPNGHTLPANAPSKVIDPNDTAGADQRAADKADAQIKDTPRSPTPEQAEAAAHKVLVGGVKRACLLLNQDGFTPALSNISRDGQSSTLDVYVAKETELGKTFAEMDAEDLEALIKNLSLKLDTFRANKKSLETGAGF